MVRGVKYGPKYRSIPRTVEHTMALFSFKPRQGLLGLALILGIGACTDIVYRDRRAFQSAAGRGQRLPRILLGDGPPDDLRQLPRRPAGRLGADQARRGLGRPAGQPGPPALLRNVPLGRLPGQSADGRRRLRQCQGRGLPRCPVRELPRTGLRPRAESRRSRRTVRSRAPTSSRRRRPRRRIPPRSRIPAAAAVTRAPVLHRTTTT